ncbi:MAG TPA: vWA domain-containing protein [Anaerolineaceae bacterium]|nr:vWA domain-containing protein [Anaerolineaceae bacterium]
MAELFASTNLQLIPRPDPVLREEIFVSAQDAQFAGLRSSEQYCIFGIQPLMPGPKDEEFAARVIISTDVVPGTIQINQHFLADSGFQPGDERFWFVYTAPAVIPIQQVIIEHPLDQGFVDREINDLRYRRNEFFVKRCMLVNPGQNIKELTLRMQGRASFYFRAIEPNLISIQNKAILVFDERTQINLFIPHRKSGVDMVVVVDGSGSMDIDDFLYDGRRRARIDGVKIALDLLFQVKLVSGSRVSSIAAIVFGRNAKMLYPFEIEMRKLVDESQLGTIRESVRHVNSAGLAKLGVDRTGTVISNALKLASDLLDLYAQENNEKMIILLSDGADWHEDSKDKSIGEVVRTSNDPAVLADSMHHDSGIRVHTVAISDEATFLRFYPNERGQIGSIPNKALLRKIAEFTDGMSLDSPNADELAHIFEDLGVGTMYPIN